MTPQQQLDEPVFEDEREPPLWMCSLPGMAHVHKVPEPFETCYDEWHAREKATKK
jgi:hypothetical protein